LVTYLQLRPVRIGEASQPLQFHLYDNRPPAFSNRRYRSLGSLFIIAVSFKQSINIIWAYAYHFWMKDMERIRRKAGDPFLPRKTVEYLEAMTGKIKTHGHILLGVIVQSTVQ